MRQPDSSFQFRTSTSRGEPGPNGCSLWRFCFMVPYEWHQTALLAHSQSAQCQGRSARPTFAGDRGQVVSQSASGRGDLGPFGADRITLIYLPRGTITRLTLMCPRSWTRWCGQQTPCQSRGRECGRRHSLGLQLLAEGFSEDKGGAVGDPPCVPLVAKEGVVSRPPGTKRRASTVTTFTSKAVHAATVKRVPSEPSGSKTSCLEVIAKSVTSAGFSQGEADANFESLR